MATKTKFGLKGKDRDSHLDLIRAFFLASIRSAEHLEEAQKVLDRLLAKHELDDGEETYLDALSDLVGADEDECHAGTIAPGSRNRQVHDFRGPGWKDAVQPSDDSQAARVLEGRCECPGGQFVSRVPNDRPPLHKARHQAQGHAVQPGGPSTLLTRRTTMKTTVCGFWIVATLLMAVAGIATADDAQDEAVRKDRKLIEGAWRIVALEINGNKANDEDAKKLSVVNGPGETWSLLSEGKEVAKGTNAFDPTQKPKTIDFTITEGGGKGNVHLGIYELGEKSRKLCFAPAGKERPTEFSSTPGSQHILVTFEREK